MRAFPCSPVALPAAPEQTSDEFRRVRARVQFVPGEHALVYTPGSALRPDVPGAGYWVMAPAKSERGAIVINRGYVAPGARGNVGAAPAGDVEIVGALRWPEEGTYFTPRDEPANNVWYRRDPASIAAAKNWGAVAPFYIEQEAPQLPGRAEGRSAGGEAAEQSSAIRDHLVRSGRRARRRVFGVAAEPFAACNVLVNQSRWLNVNRPIARSGVLETFTWLFLSLRGRISRQEYWLGYFGVIVLYIVLIKLLQPLFLEWHRP